MTVDANRHEHIQQICAATARALTGVPELHFRDGVLHRGAHAVHAPAPHLRTHDDHDDLGSFRGAADGLALRLLHSDTATHLRARPDDEIGRLVFELLEQFRVESLADAHHAGTIANLRHRHEAWSAQFHASGMTETGTGLLLFTVAQVGRARVTAQPVVHATEDVLEATRFGLAPLIGGDLRQLRSLRHDQEAYAEPAGRIAVTIAELAAAQQSNGPAPRGGGRGRGTDWFSVALSEHDLEAHGSDTPRTGGTDPAGATPYAAFTRAFDREISVASLTRRDQLVEYRHHLDELVEQTGVDVRWVARLLQNVADTTQETGWNHAQEEGVIDAGRLSRLVTSASDPRVFRTPRHEPHPELQVTILLDCSGSMRQHQERTAVIVDLLARGMDLAGIDNELLGFTTATWNGGRAMRAWRRAGRPPRPGRLNERLHLLVKDQSLTWSKARHQIAGLLRPDFYREALDGEAIEWAVRRLQARADIARRVLLVFSDGSAMDGATTQANGPSYLDRHLVSVLDEVTATGAVAVTGIGMGADLGHHYPHAHTVDPDAAVDRQLLRELVGVLAEASHRRRAW